MRVETGVRPLRSDLKASLRPFVLGWGLPTSPCSEGTAADAERAASETMRVAMLGNFGSGKSTWAGWLATSASLAVLDLDSIAWEPDKSAEAQPSAMAEGDVSDFCTTQARWVVEGYYPSQQAEDANLQFLLSCVGAYHTREGLVSLRAHQALFAKYVGRKVELQRVPPLSPQAADSSASLR